jgi:hypothetical protein
VKRSIVLALFAALALAVGVGSVATAAGDGAAQASKKGKKCKKGTGKAGKSTATAQAKKKGKGCKKKTPKAPPQPEELTEGVYSDAVNGVELKLEGYGKGFFASVKFSIPASCATLAFDSGSPTPANPTNGGVELRGKGTISVAGEPFDVSYAMTVTSDASYQIVVDAKAKNPSIPCDFKGAITGRLSKQGG